MSKREESLRNLELNTMASLEDVESAYYELMKVWHPDRFQGDDELRKKAEERTKKINMAYQYLIHNWTEPQKNYFHYSNSKANKESQQNKESKQKAVKKEKPKKNRSFRKAYTYLFLLLLISGALIFASGKKRGFFPDLSSVTSFPKESYISIKEQIEKSANRKQKLKDSSSETVFVTSSGLPGESFSPVPGARVSFGTQSTAPSIIKASIDCNLEALKKELNKGVSVNTTDRNGNTSLSWAAKQGCASAVELLIKNRANINHKSSNGFTPLTWANLHKRKKVIKILQNAGSAPSAKYWETKEK